MCRNFRILRLIIPQNSAKIFRLFPYFFGLNYFSWIPQKNSARKKSAFPWIFLLKFRKILPKNSAFPVLGTANKNRIQPKPNQKIFLFFYMIFFGLSWIYRVYSTMFNLVIVVHVVNVILLVLVNESKYVKITYLGKQVRSNLKGLYSWIFFCSGIK